MPDTEHPSIPSWDVADRMRKGLREAGMEIQEMAEYLGVARNTVSTWVNGRIQPSTQTLRLWAMRCGVDYHWLTYGEPEYHVPAARAIAEARVKNPCSARSPLAAVTLLYPALTGLGPSVMQAAS